MRTPPTSSTSKRELAHLRAWAALMLAVVARFAGFGALARFVDHRLWQLRHMIAQLIVIRAEALVRGLRRSHGNGPRRPLPGLMRAVIGSALRRALCARDRRAQIATLRHALARLDAYAATLARRLAHGLTRRRPILARASAVALTCVAPHAPAICADTS